MRKVSIILFSIAFAVWQSGCGGTPDTANNNTNVGAAAPTPTAAINTNQDNANAANSDVKKEESVPTFTDANTALAEGNKYNDANENEKAIDAYKQAVKLNPDLAEAYFKLGVIYSLLEKEKEGEVDNKVTEPVVSKTPKKGKEVVKKKDSAKSFEEAVKAYKKILVKNPKDDVAYFNIGRSYNKLNEDKEAEKALRQAVKLKPDDSEYQTELGAILIKFAKYDEAIGVLKKALKLDATNSQAEGLIEIAEAGKRRQEYGQPKENK